jgi:hypothetical protein
MFRRKVFILILNLVVLLWASLAQAYVGLCCAHCGGNMPLNLSGGGIPEPKEFRFKMSEMFMEMGPLRDGTSDILSTTIVGAANGTTFPAVPRAMQQYMTMIGGAYSFSDDFALMAMTNYTINEMQMEIFAGVGGNNFTMTSSGIGDITLLGKYRLYANDNLVPTKQAAVLFGLSLPTGDIHKKFTNNTVTNQNGTILPFKMQMGSGTVDPIIGLTYQGSRDPFWWGLNTQLEAHVYDNEQGYHRGQEFRYDFYAMKQVHDNWVVQAQLNGWYEGHFSREPYEGRINGEGHAGFNPQNNFLSPLFDPHNYGGHKVAISLGVQFQPIPLHVMELTATLPIHQDLNGPQLRDNWMMQLSYYMEIPTKKSRRYKGFKPPKELGF